MKKLNIFKIAIGIMLLHISLSLTAEEPIEIITEQQLSLGTIVIGNDNRVSTIKIAADGRMSTTGSAWVLMPGQPAIFTLHNSPPFKRLHLTVTILKSETTNGDDDSNQFILKEIKAPKDVIADENGMASFNVGGTFESVVGNSKRYYDHLYKADYYITVNYY